MSDSLIGFPRVLSADCVRVMTWNTVLLRARVWDDTDVTFTAMLDGAGSPDTARQDFLRHALIVCVGGKKVVARVDRILETFTVDLFLQSAKRPGTVELPGADGRWFLHINPLIESAPDLGAIYAALNGRD